MNFSPNDITSAAAAPVTDNGNTEQSVSADIADNETESTGNSGDANGSKAENSPNTGLSMGVILLFIAVSWHLLLFIIRNSIKNPRITFGDFYLG